MRARYFFPRPLLLMLLFRHFTHIRIYWNPPADSTLTTYNLKNLLSMTYKLWDRLRMSGHTQGIKRFSFCREKADFPTSYISITFWLKFNASRFVSSFFFSTFVLSANFRRFFFVYVCRLGLSLSALARCTHRILCVDVDSRNRTFGGGIYCSLILYYIVIASPFRI